MRGLGQKEITFSTGKHERETKRKKVSKLLFSILGVPPVIIHQAKSESSSTQRGLRVGTKKMRGFTEDPKEEISGNQFFSGLGGVLETSFGSTTLQEVGILLTLVYFHLKGGFGSISTLSSRLALSSALRGCLAWVKTTLIAILRRVCGQFVC